MYIGQDVERTDGRSKVFGQAAYAGDVRSDGYVSAVLVKSTIPAGTISGFSKVGTTLLDLGDIGFVSAGEATFSGTSSGGVQTVTDGTHTARIGLSGNYRSSTFVCASDGLNGVIVQDPTQGAPAPPPGQTHALVAAMASLGAGAPAASHAMAGLVDHPATLLAAPR